MSDKKQDKRRREPSGVISALVPGGKTRREEIARAKFRRKWMNLPDDRLSYLLSNYRDWESYLLVAPEERAMINELYPEEEPL